MKTLTIEADSAEAAHELYAVLTHFYPAIDADEHDEGLVSVFLPSDKAILEVFDAIESYLAEQTARKAIGPPVPEDSTRLRPDGITYVIHS
jgi:hypothetical protein